jgi:hypothetical protein
MEDTLGLQVVDEATSPAKQRVVLESRKALSDRVAVHPLATSKS